MAQLYFRYGTMNSGKSIEILKVAYNYEEQGKPVVLLTSRLDNRDGVGYISSRIGMKRKAYPIGDDTDIFGYIAHMDPRPYCVLVDEAQFLTRANVYDLARIVDELDIPVMAFGLKNDFQNNLFEGSKYLLLLSDKIDESRLFVIIARERQPWFFVWKMVSQFMREHKFKLEDTRVISPFAENTGLIHLKKT